MSLCKMYIKLFGLVLRLYSRWLLNFRLLVWITIIYIKLFITFKTKLMYSESALKLNFILLDAHANNQCAFMDNI